MNNERIEPDGIYVPIEVNYIRTMEGYLITDSENNWLNGVFRFYKGKAYMRVEEAKQQASKCRCTPNKKEPSRSTEDDVPPPSHPYGWWVA